MPILQFAFLLLLGILLYPASFLLLDKCFGEIIFYRGILHALLVFVIQIVLGIVVLDRGTARTFIPQVSLRRFCSLALASLALSFNLTFLIVFPVTFDRSVTTYLLEELAHKNSLSSEQMQALLIDDYILKNKAVLRRMKEQEISGNVTNQGDSYILTPQGQRFISISRRLRRLFDIPAHSPGEVAATPEHH